MKWIWVMALWVAPLGAAENSFLLRGATVHPVTSAPIANGSVLVREGRIVEVGARVAAPKGVRVIEVKGLHVYPGLIDSGTEIGLDEIGSVRETNDAAELGLFKPQLHAARAVNPASKHIPVSRSNGITTVMTLPDGGVIAGQGALIHLDGWTVEDMAVRMTAVMRMNYPEIRMPSGRFQMFMAPGAPRVTYAEVKRRHDEQVQQLEDFVESARRYQRAKTAGGPDFHPDLKMEAMLPVLDGKMPLLIFAQHERAIRDAIGFAKKEKVRAVLGGGAEAWKVAGDLKAAGIPVALGPTLRLPEYEDDPYDRPFAIPGELVKAGVEIAFCTFGPSAGGANPRNLPYEAAAAVPFGLSPEDALKAITINPARMWGVADEIGSLEKGKWADLIVTDGDPLEIRTTVKQMFIKGQAVDLDNPQHQLYEKYLNRP